nr:CDT1-like protein a, chloroplastic isoform X1 [Tanacetum cinerariifolium]
MNIYLDVFSTLMLNRIGRQIHSTDIVTDFDVPEAELPEAFNQREITVSVPALPVDSSNKTLPNIAEAELLNPSHLPPSFKKRFSAKVVYDSAKTELLPSPVLPSSIKNSFCGISFDRGSSAPALPVDSSNKLPNITEAELLNPSHLPPSFKKRFSAKAV